jgi:hypothetical protein
MRPSAIRVFDGLRVTTEHVEHLQAALDTAVRDLREIVGIGQVHRGFEVREVGPASIEVGPGLAFDLLGNRVVADERQALDVTFTEGAPDPLVCIRHEQVETGEVEGVQTLVFDSASAFLADAPPGPADVSIVVARLVRTAAGGDPPAFEVVDLRRPEAPALPANEATDGAIVPGEPLPGAAAGAPGDAASEPPGGPVAEPPPGPVPAPAAPAPGVGIRTALGVVRLGQHEDAAPALAGLAPEGRLPLGEVAVAMPFEPALLSTDVQLTARLRLQAVGGEPVPAIETPSDSASGSEPESESAPRTVATSPAPATLELAATARGEAAFDAGGVAQHGLTTVEVAYAAGDGPATAWSGSQLAEGQLAGFDLDPLLAEVEALDLGPVGAALAALEISLEAAGTPDSVVLRCWLGWKGAVDSELLERLTAAAPTLGWTAQVAWRGVGMGPPSIDVQPAGGA